MDGERCHSLKSPVISSLIKILNSFLNGTPGTVKFLRIVSCFRTFDHVALEMRIRSSTFSLNNSPLTISQFKITMTLFLPFSLLPSKLQALLFAKILSIQACYTLNSKLPRKTFKCAGRSSNFELNAFPISFFDFIDFSFSLYFFLTRHWILDFILDFFYFPFSLLVYFNSRPDKDISCW